MACFLSRALGPTVVGFILEMGSLGDSGVGVPFGDQPRFSTWRARTFEVGRWPCLPGRFPFLLWSPISRSLMGSSASGAELSACQARGPPEDDKRAFCLQALSFLLWGDPSPLREEGSRQMGEGRGSSPNAPRSSLSPETRLVWGQAAGRMLTLCSSPTTLPAARDLLSPCHLGRSGRAGRDVGVKGTASGMIVEQQQQQHVLSAGWNRVI